MVPFRHWSIACASLIWTALAISTHAQPDLRSSDLGRDSNAGEPVQLGAVTVTGSNIRGVEQAKTLPVTRIDSDQIELIGAFSAGEILKTLPQVEASISNIGPTTNGPNDAGGDSASVNLRGLGDGNTLVLMNGRRLSVYGIAPNTPPVVFVNVNQIPVAAIERIEVLRDGASAIYGSEASGGVVNFILKKNYEGTESRVRLAGAAGGYDEISGSLAFGRRYEGGRSNLSLVLSYYQRAGLDASDRWFSADPDKTAITDAPFNANFAVSGRSSSGPYGRFSRINAYNPDGTIARSTSFFVQPAANGNGVTVVQGAGPTFTYNSQGTRQIIGDVKRSNVFATFNRTLNTRVDFFAEASYYYAHSYSQIGEIPTSGNATLSGTDNVIVPATNYYNPYGVRLNPSAPRDVLIRNYRPVELGPRTFNVDIDSFRLLGGLTGRVGETWHWETGATYMESLTRDYQGNLLSQSKWTAQLALNTPDAFNVFGGPNANSAAVLDQARITDWTRGTGELTLLDAKAGGDVADFWGGPIAVALGGEYRHEQLKERNGPYGLADDVISISGQNDISATRDVYAGYAEVSVPVVGTRNHRDYLNSLDFTAAGRYEDFGGFHAAKPKIGLGLTTLPWLKFRSSYGEGFRAPSVSELFQSARGRRNTGLTDTARVYTVGGVSMIPEDAAPGVSKLVITGGNPDLAPENSRSWNTGVILDVPPVKGLTFGVDFWGIRQTNRIDSPFAQDELNQDNLAWQANRGSNPNVIRAARTQFDVDHNLPGVLVSINGTYQNLATRESQGYDLFGDYEWRSKESGRVRFHAETSRYLVLRDIDTNGVITELIHRNTHPRWRAASSLSWAHGAWTAGIFMRYVGDYDGDPSLTTNGLVYKIDSWTTFNVAAGYQFSRGLLKGATLRVGANNVFDRDPPFNPGISDGYDAGNANAYGRLLFTELRWKY